VGTSVADPTNRPDHFVDVVPTEWIDRNGHLDTIHYKSLVDRARRQLFDYLGLDRGHFASGFTLFNLEMHALYEREIFGKETICILSHVAGGADKVIHSFHEIFRPDDPRRCAGIELLTLHVDQATRRGTPFPPAIAARLQQIAAEHSARPAPQGLSSRIVLRP